MFIELEWRKQVFMNRHEPAQIVLYSRHPNPFGHFIIIRLDIVIAIWKIDEFFLIKRIDTARPRLSQPPLCKRQEWRESTGFNRFPSHVRKYVRFTRWNTIVFARKVRKEYTRKIFP